MHINIKAARLLIIWGISILFLTSCGLWKEVMKTERVTDTENPSEMQSETQADRENQIQFPKIPIDFPFPYGMEGYTLILAPSGQEEDALKAGEKSTEEADMAMAEYEIRLYDEKEQVIQQFPCCIMPAHNVNAASGFDADSLNFWENLRFSYDDLTNDSYADLQIFLSDEELLDSFSGLCFAWDWKEHKFIPEAIEIPAYAESRWGGILVIKDTEDYLEKTIYQVNQDREKCLVLRSWILYKDSEVLKIWDWLEERNLFEGKVGLGEDWEPENLEYYDTLFWAELPILGDYSVDSTIHTVICGQDYARSVSVPNQEGLPAIPRKEWGHNTQTAEYPDKQTLLEDFGFWGTEPFYEYYDIAGKLQAELYFDASSQRGCGIRYVHYCTSNLESKEAIYGFTFDSMFVQDCVWEEIRTFSTNSWQGGDGADSVKEYEKQEEYRQDGRPDYHRSQGIIEDLGDEGLPMMVLDINWVYRDDGSLYYKDYNHNSYIFGTSCCYIRSYYDKAERLLFEKSYITHGRFEDYYIYMDDEKKPAYCLSLDYNVGTYIPVMKKY